MTKSCEASCDSKHPLQDISNSNRKITAARDLVALIRKGQFEEFACLLESTNADWNTFVHGNTALHYCLMLGELLLPFEHVSGARAALVAENNAYNCLS